MEVKKGNAETVRIGRCVEGVPGIPFVGRVMNRSTFRDEIGAILGVRMHRHRNDVEIWHDEMPRIAFVRRLPNFISSRKSDEGLETLVSSRHDIGIGRRTCDSPK